MLPVVLIKAQDTVNQEISVNTLLSNFNVTAETIPDNMMTGLLILGEQGMNVICSRINPNSEGDDVKARRFIDLFSDYMSVKGMQRDKNIWEKVCISYALGQNDAGVKKFFIRQLQVIGGNASIDALKIFLTDPNICFAAVNSIAAIGGENAENAFSEALHNPNLPCAAAVMNALASMKSSLAVEDYILWSSDINVNTKKAAYNALAMSGSSRAYPVLYKAAKDLSFRWDRTNATESLLNYAKNVGSNGDLDLMDKICRQVISKCNDKLSISNKFVALEIYTSFHGIEAMNDILKAAAFPNPDYRNAAIKLSLNINDNEVAKSWIRYFPEALPEARPEIIKTLGIIGDKISLPLITESLNSVNQEERAEAVSALAKINGKESASALVEFMLGHDQSDDLEAASDAFRTIAGEKEIDLLIPVLKDGSPFAVKTTIEIMSWSNMHKYFAAILPYSSSDNLLVKGTALMALARLADENDQMKLIELISQPENAEFLPDLQQSLAALANKNIDPERRSDLIIRTLHEKPGNIGLIQVLPLTGGKNALETLYNEFENGDVPVREASFKALTSWSDYTATDVFYRICASKNKTYEEPAFHEYIRRVSLSVIPDEEKLLSFNKIMPYAISAGRKNEILTETGKLKSYQSLIFVGNYLDDPLTAASAAKSAMYIALPSVNDKVGMQGAEVKEILLKAAAELKGRDSEYNRNLINKYLEGMPVGDKD